MIHESIVSKRSPTNARRSLSSVRTSFNSEVEESLCGGGEGVRSLGIGRGRSCFRTHWSSTSFRYPKEATTPAPIAKEHLTLTNGSSSKGTLKWWRKRVTRWGYGRGALDRNALYIWYRTRWAQSIWQSVWRATTELNLSQRHEQDLWNMEAKYDTEYNAWYDIQKWMIQQAIYQTYLHVHYRPFYVHHELNRYTSNHQPKCPQQLHLDYSVLSMNKTEIDQPQLEFYAPQIK